MKTKETIAIIGATGNTGSAIAANLSKDSYRLILMSGDAEKLRDLENTLATVDAKAVVLSGDCPKEASWEADVIILACANETQREIAEKIRAVATGKIVISISDPFRTRPGNRVIPGNSAGEELQKLLPDSKVVKVFSATLAGSSPVDGKMPDAFIATNNGRALDTISRIVASAGFNPILVGDLSTCQALEHMQLKFIYLPLRMRSKGMGFQRR